MKKFGTPIGAGPGSANENVGFAAVGTPLAERGFSGATFGLDCPGPPGEPGLPFEPPPLPPERVGPPDVDP
jgi:hypothetical protein